MPVTGHGRETIAHDEAEGVSLEHEQTWRQGRGNPTAIDTYRLVGPEVPASHAFDSHDRRNALRAFELAVGWLRRQRTLA